MPVHLKDVYNRACEGLSKDQCLQVANLLKKHASTFSNSDTDIGRTGIIRHKIDTGDAHPIKQPLRRMPFHMQGEADKQIETMLQNNIIKPSASPWASGIVMVEKKDGSKRFCVDYRKINDITKKDLHIHFHELTIL